jgi:hypothetical protein
MRLNTEGSNPLNQNIQFYNNIWADPTGSMGTEGNTTADFAEVPTDQNLDIGLNTNLYWNGVNPIPPDNLQLIHYTDDLQRLVGDALLSGQSGLVVPHWDGSYFADGSESIRAAFERLARLYGAPGVGSPAIDAANPTQAPLDDILGHVRGLAPDIGAYESNAPWSVFLPICMQDSSSNSP